MKNSSKVLLPRSPVKEDLCAVARARCSPLSVHVCVFGLVCRSDSVDAWPWASFYLDKLAGLAKANLMGNTRRGLNASKAEN